MRLEEGRAKEIKSFKIDPSRSSQSPKTQAVHQGALFGFMTPTEELKAAMLINEHCSSPLDRPLISDLSSRDCEKATSTVLFRLKFSPLALRIDEFGDSYFGSDTCGGFLIHGIAKIISALSPHKSVELSLSEGRDCDNNFLRYRSLVDCDFPSRSWEVSPSSWLLADSAIAMHRLLISGNSLSLCLDSLDQAEVPHAILLTWCLGRASCLLEVITATARIVPSYRLKIEQTIALPMAYALYRETTYMPPSDLMTIQSSIVRSSTNNSSS